MGSYCLFNGKQEELIGIITQKNELYLLSPKNGEILKRSQLSFKREICYAMEIGSYWGFFPGTLSPEKLLIIDPDSLAILEEFSLIAPFLRRSCVGITPESLFTLMEVDTIAEIALKDLRMKKTIDISDWSEPIEFVDLSISLNAQVVALAMIDFITIWDMQTKETIYHDEGHSMGHLSLNPLGTYLAMGDDSGSGAEILDIQNGTSFETEGDYGRPLFMEWSPAGDCLAYDRDYARACEIWNIKGEKVAHYTFPDRIESITWISNEEIVIIIENSVRNDATQSSIEQTRIYLCNIRREESPRLLYPS